MKQRMSGVIRRLKIMGLASGSSILVLGGGCLTENFWVEKSSEIANLVILSAFDAFVLSPIASGLAT